MAFDAAPAVTAIKSMASDGAPAVTAMVPDPFLLVDRAATEQAERATEQAATQRAAERVVGPSLREPPLMTLLRLGEYRPQQSLRDAIAHIRWSHPELCSFTEVDEWVDEWELVQEFMDAGCRHRSVTDLLVDECWVLGLCCAQKPEFFTYMNQALCSGEMASASAGSKHPWTTVLANFMGGLAKLPSICPPSGKLFHTTLIPAPMWKAWFESHEGSIVCFYSALRTTSQEQWQVFTAAPQILGTTVSRCDIQAGVVPCILEFHNATAKDATGVWSSCGPVEDVNFLLPYTRGTIRSIRAEQAPNTRTEVFRVCIDVARSVEPLPSIVQAPAESSLAGALLVGLHTSTSEKSSPLLTSVAGCFEALAAAVKVKSPEAVTAVWKGYFECLMEGVSVHSWKDKTTTIKAGLVDVAFGVRKESLTTQAVNSSYFAVDAARVAVTDFARVARGVTKRALGCESCLNHEQMNQENGRRMQDVEELKWNAVAVARDQVNAMELETLTDPESFIRFMQHDPVKAFEVVPAAIQAYISAEPAQQVFLFAKLIGLVTMAGRLLRGDAQVQSAFDSSFPLSGGPWDDILNLPSADEMPEVQNASAEHLHGAADEMPCRNPDADRLAQAHRALAALRLQQLQLARTRLMIVGGAPDAGKSTLLQKVFGLHHLAAGLNRAARTNQLTFMLHPDGDEQHCPIYLVDTPGFGDGEQLHRNDMARLLLGAGSWLPDGTTLVWVIRAGRSVRQEADELLRKFAVTSLVPIIIVTHIDKLFEDRYRELGPLWKQGELQGVPSKDPQWAAKRKLLMNELQEEVTTGIEAVLGSTDSLEVVYACLGGWMSCGEHDDDDDEDEFAQSSPWPWAREELAQAFGIQSKAQLRQRLDAKLGFS